MRSLLTRLAPLPSGSASSSSVFNPSYSSPLSAALSHPRRAIHYQGNSGRSSSRDGSERAKPARAPEQSKSSSSRSASTSAVPQRPCAPPLRQQTVKSAGARERFVLPHATSELVGVDSFFATHRPLLELPVRLSNRRSTRQGASSVVAAEDAEVMSAQAQPAVEMNGRTVQVEEDFGKDVARVVDLAEDGTPLGAPYLVRLDAVEPLKSVEEELAAEEKEEAALMQKVEQLHQQEAESVEPYDAWMIGQHQVQPAAVARYLAVHPPFAAPSSTTPATTSSSAPSTVRSHLAYLTPFTSSAPSPLTPSAFPAFVDHFVAPLEPQESSALADQFLSSAQMKQSWAAHDAFVRSFGERLRVAEQAYKGVSKVVQEAFPTPVAKEQRGSIRVWDEQEGWRSLSIAQNDVGLNGSPFLPADTVEIEEVVVSLDSVKRKRHKKMLKHKYRKRRKAQRALRQRLGK
ncbi:hypothetical protein JCM8547_002607 [Rhodosporidiobolus lusitaniae]